MADNRNPLLRQAFEEAARREINELPAENLIVRPYSKEHGKRMNQILNGEQPQKKRISFRRAVAVVLAAVITMSLFVVGTSALLNSESMQKLFNFTPDSENYESIDIDFEGIVEYEDDYDTLIYTGKPITVKYTVDTGESWNWPDKGIMIYIDGVRQTFDAKVSEESYKNIDMLHLENKQGEIREIEFTFEPNIGKKGDEMFISFLAIFDPDVNYFTQCRTERKGLFVCHWDDDNNRICDRCMVNIDEIPSGPSSYTIDSQSMIKVVMEKDAPVQTAVVKNFSGTKVDKLNDRIYDGYSYEDSFENEHNGYDEMQSLVAAVYKSINESYVTDNGVNGHRTRIETKAKENDDFIINLHGATGKYRVSLYINNELQNVFDGEAYADVDVVYGQQSELNIKLDTTKLNEGDNYCYVLFQKLDGEGDVFRWIHYSLVYTIEVE